MAITVVRHRPRADQGDTNQKLVEEVFAEIVERCEEGQGPNPQPATIVGSYGFGI